ncbi:unnamed protein product [Enterobius vermicularis]|uniref:Secreted protein n=1 Tax=Enterobius vermicularis TaxID=51028 RepID=A0A0N4V322_ENTVE|nr:unnamed protein product [Enterobius vermicularis]
MRCQHFLTLISIFATLVYGQLPVDNFFSCYLSGDSSGRSSWCGNNNPSDEATWRNPAAVQEGIKNAIDYHNKLVWDPYTYRGNPPLPPSGNAPVLVVNPPPPTPGPLPVLTPQGFVQPGGPAPAAPFGNGLSGLPNLQTYPGQSQQQIYSPQVTTQQQFYSSQTVAQPQQQQQTMQLQVPAATITSPSDLNTALPVQTASEPQLTDTPPFSSGVITQQALDSALQLPSTNATFLIDGKASPKDVNYGVKFKKYDISTVDTNVAIPENLNTDPDSIVLSALPIKNGAVSMAQAAHGMLQPMSSSSSTPRNSGQTHLQEVMVQPNSFDQMTPNPELDELRNAEEILATSKDLNSQSNPVTVQTGMINVVSKKPISIGPQNKRLFSGFHIVRGADGLNYARRTRIPLKIRKVNPSSEDTSNSHNA